MYSKTQIIKSVILVLCYSILHLHSQGATVVVWGDIVTIGQATIMNINDFNRQFNNGGDPAPNHQAANDLNNDIEGGADLGSWVYEGSTITRTPTPPLNIWETKDITAEAAAFTAAFSLTGGVLVIAASLGAEITMTQFMLWVVGIPVAYKLADLRVYHAILNWKYHALREDHFFNTTTLERFTQINTENIEKPVKAVLEANLSSLKFQQTIIDNTELLRWW